MPNPIDVHVGERIRQRRMILGVSQENLGNELGVSFQQVQKYENGANRISASRLFDVARVFDVAVQFFFDEMPEKIVRGSNKRSRSTNAQADDFVGDPMTKHETLELVRAYYRISDPRLRKRLFEMTKTLAKTTGTSSG